MKDRYTIVCVENPENVKSVWGKEFRGWPTLASAYEHTSWSGYFVWKIRDRKTGREYTPEQAQDIYLRLVKS